MILFVTTCLRADWCLHPMLCQCPLSGDVDLRFHVMKHRQLRGPVDRTARPRSPQKTFKMAQALELSKSTMSVLSAFKRAHSRMQASKKWSM